MAEDTDDEDLIDSVLARDVDDRIAFLLSREVNAATVEPLTVTVGRLELASDDVLVVAVPDRDCSAQLRDHITQELETILANRVMVIPESFHLAKIAARP